MNLSLASNAPEPGTIAAIDIGTNSIHLVVARFDPLGSLTILDADKVNSRLGQAIGPDNNLEEEAIARAVDTIRHMKQIASAYPCRIRAVATHATRVATNHERLLDSIKDATGIDVEVIDGVEEARLSFLGMRYGLSLGNNLCLGVDVGGGSTELIIAKGEQVRFVMSLNLGAVVLTKRHFKSKGPSKSDIKELEDRIMDTLSPLAKAVKQFNIDRAVIASGTAKALAMIDASKISDHKQIEELRDPNGYILSAANLNKIADKLEDLKEPSKIKDYAGIDQSRADIILAGTLVVKGLTKAFNIKEWVVSSYGLREGIIVDTHMRLSNWSKGDHKDVRWVSVQDFCKRVQIDEEFAAHVAKLALQIYDGLVVKVFPKLDKDDRLASRELLHAAALLHEAGKFLSYTRYHRHSSYLILNSSLMGFTQNEKTLMALIARFHRKGIANSKSDDLNLSQRELTRVNFLAGTLRLATALNRTRQNHVRSVGVQVRDDKVDFSIRHPKDEFPEVELHMAEREKSALKKTFGLDVSFRSEEVR